jgi:signal transduction histidine kinase/ligand-binding sensor domain-containing protein
MRSYSSLRIVFLVSPVAITLLFAALIAQTQQPSPTQSPKLSPSPSVSPTASPSASPTPSPTPLPGAQNFHQWGSITVFNGLPSDSVRAIAQTVDGVMWFGTDNGLVRFDGRRIQRIALSESGNDRVIVLKPDPFGNIWAGTASGAYRYAKDRFDLIANTENTTITSMELGNRPLFGTAAGHILQFGSEGRVVEMFAESLKGDDDAPVPVTGFVDFETRTLATTSGGGVYVVADGSVSEFRTSPRPLFVNSVVQLDDGRLLFGTDASRSSSGILLIGPDSKAERVTAATGNILAVEKSDDGIWAGSERSGLFHVIGSKIKKNYTFENTSGGLRSDNIFTLFIDREGVLWIGTNRGVSRFDRSGALQETVSSIPNSNFIRSLFRTSDGRLYAGSNRGLFVKDVDKWNQVPAFGNGPIYEVSQDRSGRLIVETEVAKPRTFNTPDGNAWMADEKGVFRERDGQREKIIDAEDVRDVYVEGDRFWAATTTRGLLHGRHDARFGWLVSTIGFEQGMPSEKAFAILRIEDALLIATNRGVVTYRPAKVAPNLIPTRIISQRVHDLNELPSTITLEYPQNSLLVEVAGQSTRTFPEEFQYAFVLTNSKGEEVARRISNDPQFAPVDIAPGDYTIESIAFNRDLLPSEPLFIRFSVAKAPFPWTATALGVLLVLSLVGLAWAVVEHRRIAQRNRELAAARLDLANEAERERRRIARDLHDQTLADLRNLMITSDKLIPDNGAFRQEIEAVSTEIRRICEDLSPSVLENVGLVAALEFLLDRTIENRKFTADESIEDRITFPINVQLQIYRIAQEVLTNIVRHSNADVVEMYVEVEPEGAFVLSIRDNGRSFRPDGNSKTGRGVSNIRSRANLINGRVAWKESRRGGNVFSLRLEPSNTTA